MFESILSFFTSPPRQGAAPLGAGLSGADDDPVLPAFRSAWKDGALIEDMFGPEPFKLHGSVGSTGADNHRPDVAKVETLLGDAGYYRPMTSAGPDGWHNPALDQSIRSFQKDKGLLVDGLLKPNGPTITAIGGLFGGSGKSNSQTVPAPAQPDRFPGHTISPQGARAHEDWAKNLPRDSKPAETARILAGTIKEHGDQGLADTADLLGRFVRHDPAKAENLRRLVSGQAGRDVPLRIAPVGEGFVAPSQEEKPARAPKQPFGPADGADLDAAASMAKALLKVGDYKNAYGYFKTAAEATPPYMAAVHDFMRRENPALAMKFAEQGVEAGMVKAQPVSEQRKPERLASDQDDVSRLLGIPIPVDDDARQDLRRTLEKARDRGKALGQDKAADLLDHYLNGDGSPVTLDSAWVRDHDKTREAEKKLDGHFETWLKGERGDDSGYGSIGDHIPRDGETKTVKGLTWDAVVDDSAWRVWNEHSNALGGFGLKGIGDLKLERRGDDVIVTGTVQQQALDTYDFGKGKTEEERKRNAGKILPQLILGGDPAVTRGRIDDLEKAGMAKPFKIQTEPWTKTVTGRLKLDKQGRVIGSTFQWK